MKCLLGALVAVALSRSSCAAGYILKAASIDRQNVSDSSDTTIGDEIATEGQRDDPGLLYYGFVPNLVRRLKR